jgi:purine-cytosine permease-like protein
MNTIKRIAGVLWIIAGPLAMYFLIKTAASEINKKPVIDTKIQWVVFVVVFIPIAIGIVIFGYYAIRGYYDHLPESSAEISD